MSTSAKIFLIFSVIAYALYQVNSFKKVMDEKFATSIVMPHLISVGSYIIKLDTNTITNGFDKAVNSVKESPVLKETTSTIKEEVNSTVNGVQEAVEKEVVQKVEDKIQDSTNATQEHMDSVKEKLKNIANKPAEN